MGLYMVALAPLASLIVFFGIMELVDRMASRARK